MALFDTLYIDCGGYLELRALRKKPISKKQEFFLLNDTKKISGFIKSYGSHDLYFSVATRDGAGGGKENIVSIPALWCDLDFKQISQAEADERINVFPFQPSIFVESGGGYHLYWKLKEPCNKSDIERIERILRGIAMVLGGDMDSTDASRILRVPNTLNYKYKPPRKVIIRYSNSSEYDLDSIEDILPDIPEPSLSSANYRGDNPALESIMQCRFMSHCKEESATLTEPEWYAMVTQLAKERGGRGLIHSLSRPYPKYSVKETDNKILHAVEVTGPMSCFKIRQYWNCGIDCGVKSPAALAYKIADHTGYVPDVPDVPDVTSGTFVPGCPRVVPELSPSCPQNVPELSPRETKDSLLNRMQIVKDWLETCDGIFTIKDLARELQFNVYSFKYDTLKKILKRLVDERVLVRVGDTRGVYRKVEKPLEEMNWWDADDEEFSINLPFTLDSICTIYPKNIIVIAGEKNSAKTAVSLEIARLNMAQLDTYYFTSEMGKAEFRSRLKLFENTRLESWRNMHVFDACTNFQDHIKPNGLNIIDFLEIHDEFWKVGGTIRAIYDRLEKGVAVINIQKKPGTDTGKGGEVTTEKARLYLSLSLMKEAGGELYNRVKIVKCKSFRDPSDNPNGKALDFKLYGGWNIIPRGIWEHKKEEK